MVAKLRKEAAPLPESQQGSLGTGRGNESMDARAAAMAVEQRLFGPGPTVGPSLVAGSPLPQSIGLCADEYNDVRTIRLAMEKEVEAVKARENEIREHIISNLSKSLDSGAAGKRYRAQIVMKTVPKLADWNKFCDYVYEHNRFDLVQKRLGEKAVEDLWAAGETIAGVDKMNVPTVSITKI